jgi:hypothetical protein
MSLTLSWKSQQPRRISSNDVGRLHRVITNTDENQIFEPHDQPTPGGVSVRQNPDPIHLDRLWPAGPA